MKILIFACADQVVVDARTNRASLLNLIDELTAPDFPAAHPFLNVFALIGRTSREKEKTSGRLDLSIGSQTKLLSTPIEIDFQGKPRARAVITIQGIIFEAPCILSAVITVGKITARCEIPVVKGTPPQIAAPLAATVPNSQKRVTARQTLKKRAKKKR